jgi:uncharacterized protein (TIGR02679 family)
MSDEADSRLLRLLGGGTLATLRQRLRRRFERTEPGAVSSFRLGGLSPHEHEALGLLTGQRPQLAGSMRIDVAAIDAALRGAGIAASLRDALERIDGPIAQRGEARTELQARWSAVAAAARHPGLAAMLHSPAGLGLLKRLARQDGERAARLRDAADAVLRRLPAGGLPRAQLAAETLGDAHALDTGQPAATLVLAALRRDAGRAESEERIRDVWARAGVLVNELARPALFLNLPVDGTMADPGEPAYASLRRLLRAPPAWAVSGRDIHVCENPNLLAIAADRLGCRCAPLVCTDGMPAAAQRTLLSQLAAAGGRLLYHGDFDWAGITIANHVMRAYGALPWRFGAGDYEAAIATLPAGGQGLVGAAVAASWDAALAPAMERHNLAIAEEGLAASLIEDLGCGGGGSCRKQMKMTDAGST